MDLSGIRRIVVLGSGESGTGAALLARKNGFDVFVSDTGSIKESYKAELVQNGIEYEEGKHDTNKILEADLIIKSPGIPDKAAVMVELSKHDKLIVGEIEFASWFSTAKIISVTGSNGKTTTTMLIYHILKNAGLDVAVGGNTGFSFARRLLERDYEYFVLELSSFQLDNIKEFRSHIAVLLNITADHLDRYHYKMEEYALSKMQISRNQKEDDFFIYDLDDEVTMKYIPRLAGNAQRIPISQDQILTQGVWLEHDDINLYFGKHLKVNIDMNILSLVGKHNRYNSMAASAAAYALDIRDEDIRSSLSSFQNIEHRLEFVAKIQDKEFINDSKATNLNAVWYALESMTKPVVWIVGGIDKGNDYSEVLSLVKSRVKAIVCLGVDNSKIIDFFSEHIEMIFDTTDMTEAVEIAYRIAAPGEVILLSPACASFDLFKNYEDRGAKFKEAVRNL